MFDAREAVSDLKEFVREVLLLEVNESGGILSLYL
jgi:hypothetical protein